MSTHRRSELLWGSRLLRFDGSGCFRGQRLPPCQTVHRRVSTAAAALDLGILEDASSSGPRERCPTGTCWRSRLRHKSRRRGPAAPSTIRSGPSVGERPASYKCQQMQRRVAGDGTSPSTARGSSTLIMAKGSSCPDEPPFGFVAPGKCSVQRVAFFTGDGRVIEQMSEHEMTPVPLDKQSQRQRIPIDSRVQGVMEAVMVSETGFGAGLDYSHLDSLSRSERDSLFRWYGETHGADASDLNAVPFVPFLADNRPGALKRWRRFLEAMSSSESSLPLALVPLLFLHFYMASGNGEGVRYEITIARKWGAKRAEVIDTINFGFLNAGPYGVNIVARAAGDVVSDWEVDDPTRLDSPIRNAARTVVAASPTHSSAFRDNIPLESWLNRNAVEAHRDRVDSVFNALPPLTAPLFLIHLGVGRANAAICDHAARQAVQLGVPLAWFESAALWGVSSSGSVGLELAAEAILKLPQR